MPVDYPLSLRILCVFSYICLAVAVVNGVAYGIGMVGTARAMKANNQNIDNLWYIFFLNVYGICFAATLAMIELRYKFFFDHFPGFRNWAVRGLFYLFVGILALAVGTGSTVFDDPDVEESWNQTRDIFSYMLCAIGALYVVGEILCLRVNLQQKKNKYRDDGNMIAHRLV